MLLLFFCLLSGLIFLYINDQFIVGKSTDGAVAIPIKGIFVTGILYYLLSRGVISKEDEKALEDKSLEELESYVLENDLLTHQEWVDLCLAESQLIIYGDKDTDMPMS